MMHFQKYHTYFYIKQVNLKITQVFLKIKQVNRKIMQVNVKQRDCYTSKINFKSGGKILNKPSNKKNMKH